MFEDNTSGTTIWLRVTSYASAHEKANILRAQANPSLFALGRRGWETKKAPSEADARLRQAAWATAPWTMEVQAASQRHQTKDRAVLEAAFVECE